MKKKKKINGPFIMRTLAMLNSPAMRVLSLNGHRILNRLEIEHMRHGGKDNGALPVTFDDLEKFDVHRGEIRRGLREVCRLGFVAITRPGRPGGHAKTRLPTLYRLTYLPTRRAGATDDWKKIKTVEEARRARNPAKVNGTDSVLLSSTESATLDQKKRSFPRKNQGTESATTI